MCTGVQGDSDERAYENRHSCFVHRGLSQDKIPTWSKKSCVGLNSKVTVVVQVSGVLLIEAADNPRRVHRLCHQTQHPKQDHHLESPRARPEPLPACPSTCRNRLSENKEKNNSAAMLYPALECFCTVIGSSSSSSCFSQQKHRKPTRRYTALWPRSARGGSITLHHDQYPATVSFKTASTTEKNSNTQNPVA